MARLRGLPPQPAGHAIAIAASLGSGFKEALKASGSQPLQVARSCEGGIVAVALAEAVPDASLRPAGFVLHQGEEVDLDDVAELLVEAWRHTAPKRLVKAYDAGHHG